MILSILYCDVDYFCFTGSSTEILHKFPNPSQQPDRFKSWVNAVGGNILELDDTFIFKNRRVCHVHFKTEYYTWSKFLTANATPTEKMPGMHVYKLDYNLGRYVI